MKEKTLEEYNAAVSTHSTAEALRASAAADLAAFETDAA